MVNGAKFILLMYNFLLCFSGLLGLGFAIWILSQESVDFFTQVDHHYLNGSIVILMASMILTVVGFLGCVGAARESRCMLSIVLVLLLTVLGMQLFGFIWTTKLDWAKEKDKIRTKVLTEYGADEATTKTVDTFQTKLECCGFDSPFDWWTGFRNMSAACCVTEAQEKCNPFGFETDRQVEIAIRDNRIHNKGCLPMLEAFITYNIVYLLIFSIFLVITEILVIIYSLFLWCSLSRFEGALL